jgi:hypothetical protein
MPPPTSIILAFPLMALRPGIFANIKVTTWSKPVYFRIRPVATIAKFI